MTLPRSVSDVLAGHVRLEIESIDRMYLNVFVPELQRTGQVIGFLMRHRGFPIASTALIAPMSRQFVSGIRDFAAAHDVPLIHFAKGQRKDDVMTEHLAGFTGREGIVFIGVAQEKAHIFRTERRRNPVTGAAYPWIVTATRVVNHYYFYGAGDDFGPFFLKFCSWRLRAYPGQQALERLRGSRCSMTWPGSGPVSAFRFSASAGPRRRTERDRSSVGQGTFDPEGDA